MKPTGAWPSCGGGISASGAAPPGLGGPNPGGGGGILPPGIGGALPPPPKPGICGATGPPIPGGGGGCFFVAIGGGGALGPLVIANGADAFGCGLAAGCPSSSSSSRSMLSSLYSKSVTCVSSR